MHIVTQETENDHLLDRGFLGPERKLYYRELVARFSHHPAITWNLGEENVQSVEQQKNCIVWLRRLLPYRQHIVVHNDHWHAKNLRETFEPHLGERASPKQLGSEALPVAWVDGSVPLLTGPAIQDFHWPDVHSHVLHFVQASAESGLPWVVTGDEMGGANYGTLPDVEDPDHDDPRRFGLWGSLMGGGAGVEWYFGWQNNSPTSDLSCENWRTRENVYRQTKIALEFFHKHLPFWRMQPADASVVGQGASCFSAPGEVYAIHLPNGGGTRFDLGDFPGNYEVKWFNPRNGGDLQDGPINHVRGPGMAWTGFPPSETSKDWLVLVRRIQETAPLTMQFPRETWSEATPHEVGIHPNGLHHALNYWRMHSGTNGVDQVVLLRRGKLFHKGRSADRVHKLWSVDEAQMMLGRALTRVAGRDMFELLEESLFAPIGLQVSAWTGEGIVDGVAVRNGTTGLHMNALNLARLGHLFLCNGRWGSRQVIPRDWVAAATQVQVSAPGPVADTDRRAIAGSGDYGINWWVNGLNEKGSRLLPDAPPGTYFAAGFNHNLCVVIPEWEMVIVRMGTDGNPLDGDASVLNAFLRRLGMAVSPLEH